MNQNLWNARRGWKLIKVVNYYQFHMIFNGPINAYICLHGLMEIQGVYLHCKWLKFPYEEKCEDCVC